jgi:undecaprenyl-diphosphatase
MTVMPNSEAASISTGDPGTRLVDARAARVALLTASLALLVLFVLTLLLVDARWSPLLRVDQGARDGLHRYAVSHAGFVSAMQLVSSSGAGVTWFAVLAPVVVWLLWCRMRRLALFVVVTAVGSSLLNLAVKVTVHRVRPHLSDPVAYAQGLSFPSGHAQEAVVGYTLLLLVFLPLLAGAWRRATVVVAALAPIAIGFSRIALGVHYVSDVLGGILLGAAWVAAMTAAFNVIGVDRERRVQVTARRSAAGPQPGVTRHRP